MCLATGERGLRREMSGHPGTMRPHRNDPRSRSLAPRLGGCGNDRPASTASEGKTNTFVLNVWSIVTSADALSVGKTQITATKEG